MNIETIEVGPFAVNCFVAWNKTSAALVIDPGAEPERILAVVKSRKLSIAAYLLTHGHVDHISALAGMYDAHPAPVAIHGKDLAWAFENVNQLPPYYTAPRRPPEIGRILEDGQEWTDGGMSYRVIHTPGHTPGGVCFHFTDEHILFTGDTLFAGSVGRTDLPGGDSRALSRSLARLAVLPDKTAVRTGHGPETTMEHEKRTNYFLQ